MNALCIGTKLAPSAYSEVEVHYFSKFQTYQTFSEFYTLSFEPDNGCDDPIAANRCVIKAGPTCDLGPSLCYVAISSSVDIDFNSRIFLIVDLRLKNQPIPASTINQGV